MELKRCANCSNGAWSCRESQLPDVCLICRFRSDGTPSEWKPKVATNADRIRAMSDEEMATHLHDIGWDCHLCSEYRRLDNEPLLRDQRCDENCFEHCLEWLKQPAEEEMDNRMPEK